MQQGRKLRTDPSQLLAMRGGQQVKHVFSVLSEVDEHAATVGACVLARYQPDLHEAVNQLNSRVMPELQTFGQFPDAYTIPPGKTFDRQECLMLLRSESSTFRGFLAETEELPEGMAKRSEVFEFGFRESFALAHRRIL